MVTKFNIGDEIELKEGNQHDGGGFKFKGVISMITITKKGVRYRALGDLTYPSGMIVHRHQIDVWEQDIKDKE